MRCGTVFMRMGAPMAIGTALWREGGLYLSRCPQMFKHMTNDRIVLDQQAIALDLAGGVTIADMPRQLHQITGDFQQWLGAATTSITSPSASKSVAVIQRCGVRRSTKRLAPLTVLKPCGAKICPHKRGNSCQMRFDQVASF